MSSHSSLNHIYRTVWNQALGAMVAVAEISSGRGRSGGASKRSRLACKHDLQALKALGLLSLGIALAWGAMVPQARANPNGAVAVHGQANMVSQGKQLTVTTQNGAGTNHSAINWQSFSIPAGNTTYFQQPNALSTVINRVVTNTPSQIFGTLGSNGHLVLVNQSGIAVGAGALVDTAGFTASTLRMSDADALAGRLRFGDGSAGAGLSVQGSILARSGDVVLLGSSVETGKDALVQTPNGATILVAGSAVSISERGLEGINFEVQAPTDAAVNLGTLKGDAVGIFAGTLKHSGAIQATRASLEGGKVVLKASGDAVVEGSGRVDATSTKGQGGRIEVLGHRVAVTDKAVLDTSGATGGGTVLVGGDYQGKNVAVPNAQMTYLGPNAELRADATDQGHGGKVIVWADNAARAYGHISATGGAKGGNGGFVETSGKNHLDVGRLSVDTSAVQGSAGTWLLDPTNVYIAADLATANAAGMAGSDTSIDTTGPTLFQTSGTPTDSLLLKATLETALASNNVEVNTSSPGGGFGNITVSSPVTWASAHTLKLNAASSITVNNSVSGLNGTLSLQSGGSISNNSGAGLMHVDKLEARASSGITLQGLNQISNLAANSFGGSVLVEAAAPGGLNIDTVGSTTGVSGYGSVTIKQHNAGDITVKKNVSSGMAGAVTLGVESGSGGIKLADSGAVTLSGLISGVSLYTNGGNIQQDAELTVSGALSMTTKSTTGDITLDNAANDFTGTVTVPSTGAGAVVLKDVNALTLGAMSNMAGLSVTAGSGLTVSGAITASSGNISLTASGLNQLLTISQPVEATNGDVSYTADNLTHTASTTTASSAGHFSEIKPFSTATRIELAGAAPDAAGTLGLSTGDVDYFYTPLLKIGNLSNTGGIQLKSALTPTHYGSMSLITGGTIGQDAGSKLTITNLNADGSAGVTLMETSGNAVTNLAGRSVSGDFQFKSSAALNLGTVDILTGINAGTRDVTLQSGGDITDSSGNAAITANILTLQAGGKIDLNTGSSVNVFNAANSGGNIHFSNLKPLTVGSVAHVGAGDTKIENTGNIALGTIDGGGALVLLRANGGNITDNNSSADNVFNASRIDFNDASTSNPGGVGTLADSIEVYHATGATLVSATAKNGGIYLQKTSGTGLLDLQGITHDGTSSHDIDIQSNTGIVNNSGFVTAGTNNGNVLLQSSGTGGIAVNSDINKGGSGTLTLRSTGASQNITLPGNLSANAGNMVIESASDVVGGASNKTLSGQNLTMVAGGVINFDSAASKDSKLQVPGTTSLTASGGYIVADNATNEFGGIVSVSSGTNVKLVDKDAITLGNLSHTGNLSVTAGGAVTGSGVIGGAGYASVTAKGGINLSGGNTAASVILNNTDTGSIVYKASRASGLSVGAVTNTAPSAADITVSNSTGNVSLTSAISASAPNSVITIATAGNFANGAGSTALTPGAGGKWLVYSTDPTLDTPGGLVNAFKHYNQTFTGVAYAGPGVGNGLLYSLAPIVLPTLTAVTKTYDGTVTVDTSDLPLTATGINGDAVTLAAASASFNDKNVGLGTTVTASGITVASAVNGAVAVYGYGVFPSTAANTGSSITTKAVTLTAPVVSKVYDGGVAYTTTAGDLTALASALASGDSVSAASMVYTDKNAGAGSKTVNLTSTTISDGNGGSNYSVTLAGNTTSTISPKPLTATLSAPGKVYDGTATAAPTMTITGGLVGSETVVASASANFNTKDVLTANLVTVHTTVLQDGTNGGLASNYSLPVGQTVAATITPAGLDVKANSAVKTYDGVAYSGGNGVTYTGFVGGETATVLGGALTYGGTSQGAIDAGSYTIVPGGLSSSNYAISYLSGPLTINAAPLSAISLSGSRPYDGTKDVAANIFTLSGLVAGQDLKLSGVGTIADKNVGDNKPVTLGTLQLGDGTKGLAKNYTFTGGTQTVSITPANLAVSTKDVTKIYDGTLKAVGVPVVSSGTLFSGDLLSAGAFAFTDKNVGSGNKTVTVGAVTVGDGVNNGNYKVSYVDNTTSTINLRPVSSWVGPATGLWSNAANWDALPDAANVLAVSIPSGANVVFDAATGSTSLQSITSAGNLGLSGGSLSVSGSVNTQQFSQTGGVLSGAGTLRVTDSFSQSGGSVVMGGKVSVNQSSGSLTMSAVSTPAVELSAVNGDINFTNVGVVDIQGIKTNSGNITVNNTGGISTSGLVVTNNGKVFMTANSPLTIGSAGVSASGDIVLTATNLTSPGDMKLNGPLRSSGGGVALTAANNLEQNSVIKAANSIQVSAGGAITYGPLASSEGSSVQYTQGGGLVTPPSGGLPVVRPAGTVPVAQTHALVELFNATADVAGNLENKLDEIVTDHGSDDVDPKKSKKDKDAVVVEGETCTE
jgi:filamentous hemagglutinin family protein